MMFTDVFTCSLASDLFFWAQSSPAEDAAQQGVAYKLLGLYNRTWLWVLTVRDLQWRAGDGAR